MTHNEDLPQSPIDGQTPEGGGRREGLPSISPMAELDPQRRNPRREARERQGSSPHRSQSPDRQRRKMDPQVLEDRVREQDEVIRRMATNIETMKHQMKGNTHSCHSKDRDRQVTLSQTESRSLRSSNAQSKTSKTSYSRPERVKTKKARRRKDSQARDPCRVSALQRWVPRTYGSVKVGIPEPRLAYEPADKALARLQSSPFVPTIENAPLPSALVTLV
ncbi:hypothetical protein HYC85_028060 [Camellia sinensis]|uniref:Uncharacterized protein n=1 Tax=Camellia sinensis TaxID=4442 RepID=A0A7J7FUC2_CAMSI|nr:hypothetical protein HYC85_028060 [Camellia sinensis]